MADVSVQMGVSGVSQFKQQMAQAQASVKSIDAALKLNEKQYKATGDAEAYMQTKTTQLNSKLQAQQNAVKSAQSALEQMKTSGVDPLSVSYKNMETQLLNAQSAVLDTQQQINELGTESSDAAGKTDQLVTSLQGLNKKISLDQVIRGIDSITTGMEKAAKKAVELGKQIWENITDSAKWADDAATQAMILNMDVEDYQRYKKVFDQVGEITVQEWQKAKQKVQKAIYDPSDEQTNILNLLGISTHEIQQGKYGAVEGAARDFEDVFWDIGEKLRAKVASGEMTQDLADTYANALFGRSFAQLNPMFALGKTGFQEALDAQVVASKEAIEVNAALNDQLVKLEGDFETLKQEVLSGLAPALTKAAEVLDSMLGRLIEYLKTEEGKQALDDMAKAVEGLFSDITNIDPEQVVQGFADVFNGIVGGLQWLEKNSGTVVTAMEAIVGGWAVLKLTGGALQILQLINGLKDLSGKNTIKLPSVDGEQNGTSGTQNVSTESVTTQNVSNATVTNETVTNETVSNATMAAVNVTAGNTTTENVATMYVGTMIGGGNNGLPNLNPGNNGTGGGLPGGSDVPLLDSGSGSGLTGLNGYVPVPVLTDGGAGQALNLPGVDTINLGNGGETVLNLPSGGGDGIQLNPGEWSIDGQGLDGGGGAGTGAGIGALLTSTVAKLIGGAALAGVIILTPSDTMDNSFWDTEGNPTGEFFGNGEMVERRTRELLNMYGSLPEGFEENLDLIKLLYHQNLDMDVLEQLYSQYGMNPVNGFSMDQYRAIEGYWDYLREYSNGGWANGWDDTAINNLIQSFGEDWETLGPIFNMITEWQKISPNMENLPGLIPEEFMTTTEDAETGLDGLSESTTGASEEIDTLGQETEIATGHVAKFGELAGGAEGDVLALGAAAATAAALLASIKAPDWGTADGSAANGLWAVPFDGYRAILHKGERVVPAREVAASRNFSSNLYVESMYMNNGQDADGLAAAMAAAQRRTMSGYGS